MGDPIQKFKYYSNLFINTLGKIHEKKINLIKLESKEHKNNSPILNSIISQSLKKYNNQDIGNLPQTSKQNLICMWNSVIENAPIDYNKIISKIWIKLFTILDKIIKLLYPNENTSENIFSQFRKSIKNKYTVEHPLYHLSVNMLGVDQKRSIEKKNEYKNKINDSNLNRRNLKPIYNYEVIDAINKGIDSSDPFKKIIALMLSTGCRQIEILKISSFSENPLNDKLIIIRGLAKNKNGFDTQIERPLIELNAKQVIDGVKYIRDNLNIESLKDKNNNEITSKFNRSLNNTIKLLFPNHPELNVHKCRYIAGQMAYLLYGKDGVENTYIQKYLGHVDGNTTRTYQSINVIMSPVVN